MQRYIFFLIAIKKIAKFAELDVSIFLKIREYDNNI